MGGGEGISGVEGEEGEELKGIALRDCRPIMASLCFILAL